MTAMSAMPGMMPGMGQPGQPQDFNKLFLAEKENIMITPHQWELEDIEQRLLEKYGKRPYNQQRRKSYAEAVKTTPPKKGNKRR